MTVGQPALLIRGARSLGNWIGKTANTETLEDAMFKYGSAIVFGTTVAAVCLADLPMVGAQNIASPTNGEPFEMHRCGCDASFDFEARERILRQTNSGMQALKECYNNYTECNNQAWEDYNAARATFSDQPCYHECFLRENANLQCAKYAFVTDDYQSHIESEERMTRNLEGKAPPYHAVVKFDILREKLDSSTTSPDRGYAPHSYQTIWGSLVRHYKWGALFEWQGRATEECARFYKMFPPIIGNMTDIICGYLKQPLISEHWNYISTDVIQNFQKIEAQLRFDGYECRRAYDVCLNKAMNVNATSKPPLCASTSTT